MKYGLKCAVSAISSSEMPGELGLQILLRHLVAGQQRVDVVRPVLGVAREDVEQEGGKPPLHRARLGEGGEVGRVGAVVHVGGRLAVRVGRREVVLGQGGALEQLALLVRPVGHLILGSERAHLVLGVAELLKVAESDQAHPVARRADLAVDLQAALELLLVIGAEQAAEGPRDLLGLEDRVVLDQRAAGGGGGRGGTADDPGGGDGGDGEALDGVHHRCRVRPGRSLNGPAGGRAVCVAGGSPGRSCGVAPGMAGRLVPPPPSFSPAAARRARRRACDSRPAACR